MSHARRVDWTADSLNGEDGYRYNEIFLTTAREHHIRLHTIMDPNRQGEHPHGMWIHDVHYPNIDEMIWAYAARSARRIASNSARVTFRQQQNGGRTRYRIRLSSTAHLGIADIEPERNLQARIHGLWYGWTQHADIVFAPMATTRDGHNVYSIITFFPVYPGADTGRTAEFFPAGDYDEFNRRRFG